MSMTNLSIELLEFIYILRIRCPSLNILHKAIYMTDTYHELSKEILSPLLLFAKKKKKNLPKVAPITIFVLKAAFSQLLLSLDFRKDTDFSLTSAVLYNY